MFKTLLIALVVMLMSVTAIAGIPEIQAAYKADNYPLCISEADKVIADSNATVADKATAQLLIGASYKRQGEYVKAISAYQKVISNYPSEVLRCASAQCYVGHCYRALKDYVKAIPAYQKVISEYPKDKYECASAQYSIGYCYDNQKDTVKANEAYLKVFADYSEEPDVILLALNKIDFVSMTNEEAVAVLKKILRATPATAKNAELLGRIKSELEKYK